MSCRLPTRLDKMLNVSRLRMRPSGDYDGDMTFVCFWLALRLTAEFVDGLPWKDIGSRHCSVSLSLRRHLTPPRRRISAGRLCPN